MAGLEGRAVLGDQGGTHEPRYAAGYGASELSTEASGTRILPGWINHECFRSS